MKLPSGLSGAFAAAGAEKDGYDLEICGLLNRAWQGIYALALPVIGARQPLPRMETARLKRMLGFIRDHFAEDISPADIAASAGVCERECFRCFRQELGTTPLATLTDFRLRRPPNCCARPTAPSATSPPPAALPTPATSARSSAAA